MGPGKLLSGGAPLGEDGAEDEQADREPAGEALDDLCDLRGASVSDGRGATDRARHREDGDDEAASDGAELMKAQGCPDEERKDQVRIAPETAEKDDRADRGQKNEQQAGFGQSRSVEPAPRPLREHEQQRRDDEVPHGVAEPPEEPRRPVVRGVDVARDEERRGAVGRGDRRAEDRGEPDQREHVAHAVESRTEADQHEKRRSDDGLERVPHRDEAGFGNRRPAGYVGHEGREGDRRPELSPVENERCQSDPGRGPDRCDEPVGDLELDPDPRRNQIRDEESRRESQVTLGSSRPVRRSLPPFGRRPTWPRLSVNAR